MHDMLDGNYVEVQNKFPTIKFETRLELIFNL